VARPVVIVTRPAAAGERLHQRLRAAGWTAHWWPAFHIGPAPDAALARQTLARLADFDLAVFVSPAAVRAVLSLIAAWPGRTMAGAVGAATAAEVRAALAVPPAALIAPETDDAGSEAFWDACQRRALAPQQVLILRAQHGREWLGERFAATGARVESLAVYARLEPALEAGERAVLAALVADRAAVATLFTSSEAVDALDRQVAAVGGAQAWLRAGAALATHPRIAERLLAAGYKRIQSVAADDAAVIAQLESLESA